MSFVTKNELCLACGSSNIFTSLDLGKQPLANSYKKDINDYEERYPLAVNLCHSCFHLQLSHTVDPEIIYKNYLYATGTNQTIKDYSNWFANYCKEYLGSLKTVLDIGCNDGTQLDYFKKLDVETYGIDPAQNLYEKSSKNHNIVCDFFGSNAVIKLNKIKYDLIIAQNVFAHNPNPLLFLESCYQLMNDDTLLFIQTSQADMILNNEFDTIYHEHINFFNTNSMNELAARAKLFLIDVVKTPIHGNSYIFILSKQNKRPMNLLNITSMEKSYGLFNLKTYEQWETNVKNNVQSLVNVLNNHKFQGYTLIGYGAAAKGNTLLNFGNIKLDCIVDDSPLKQGKLTPGTNCPIVSIQELVKFNDDHRILFVPLAWNFFNEIKTKIKSVRNNKNDLFVKYFPHVEINK